MNSEIAAKHAVAVAVEICDGDFFFFQYKKRIVPKNSFAVKTSKEAVLEYEEVKAMGLK